MKTLIEIDELAQVLADRVIRLFRGLKEPRTDSRWETVYSYALSILQQVTGHMKCEECDKLFQNITPCDDVCSDCRLEKADTHIKELVTENENACRRIGELNKTLKGVNNLLDVNNLLLEMREKHSKGIEKLIEQLKR